MTLEPRLATGPARTRMTRLLILAAVAIGALEAIPLPTAAELAEPTGHLTAKVASQLLPWCWLALLLPAVVWMADRFPLDAESWRRHLPRHLGAMAAFALVQIGGHIAIGYALAYDPVSLSRLSLKVLLYRFPIDVLVYWSAVGAVQAARASALVRAGEQAAARLEAALAETRLAALRDRLNPHFLFNTLNAVTTLALRQDHAGVIRTVDALSDLLRAVLAEGKGQEVTLLEELAFLDRYLEIERLRLGDRVTFVRRIDESLGRTMVPFMILQPLVENAVRHGAGVKPGPVTIEIAAQRVGETLQLEVSDTGPGFSPTTPPTPGIGLANTRGRLAGLYGPKGTLWCGNRPGGGAVVTVQLPIDRS